MTYTNINSTEFFAKLDFNLENLIKDTNSASAKCQALAKEAKTFAGSRFAVTDEQIATALEAVSRGCIITLAGMAAISIATIITLVAMAYALFITAGIVSAAVLRGYELWSQREQLAADCAVKAMPYVAAAMIASTATLIGASRSFSAQVTLLNQVWGQGVYNLDRLINWALCTGFVSVEYH